MGLVALFRRAAVNAVFFAIGVFANVVDTVGTPPAMFNFANLALGAGVNLAENMAALADKSLVPAFGIIYSLPSFFNPALQSSLLGS